MVTREEAYSWLGALGVAPVFLESYRSRRLPEDLDCRFGPPEEFFTLAEEIQAEYDEGGRLVALLDDGNFDVVLFYDRGTQGFVAKSVEEPEAYTRRFSSWDQYLATLMRNAWEEDKSDAELARISALIRFAYMAELSSLLERINGLPDDQREEEWQRFIDELGTKHPRSADPKQGDS